MKTIQQHTENSEKVSAVNPKKRAPIIGNADLVQVQKVKKSLAKLYNCTNQIWTFS